MQQNQPWTRRRFLSRAATCGGAALSLPLIGAIPAFAAQTNSAKGWQIGCYTRAFDQFDYEVALEAIAASGFKYVGLMTTNTKQWAMVKPSTPREEVRGFKEAAAKRGLKVLSVYGDFQLPESRAEGIAALEILIDHCAACACPNLLLGGTSDAKLYQRYYETVRECCSYAASKGVSMTIKPHGGQNATGPECRKAIELVRKSNFGLWYDPGNVFYYSDGKIDPVDDARTVDGLVTGVSVKDFQPPKDVLVNPGSGKVDFPKVFAALRRGGFDRGPVLVECLKRGTLNEVKTAARNARVFLEQILAV